MLEEVKEILEQEFGVQLGDDVWRQFSKESVTFRLFASIVLILGPVVEEMLFNIIPEFVINRSVPIELSKDIEPLYQHDTFPVVLSNFPKCEHNSDEGVHDERKDSHADNHDERVHHTLDVTLGMLITIANGAQGCESEIDDHYKRFH